MDIGFDYSIHDYEKHVVFEDFYSLNPEIVKI